MYLGFFFPTAARCQHDVAHSAWEHLRAGMDANYTVSSLSETETITMAMSFQNNTYLEVLQDSDRIFNAKQQQPAR